MSMSGNLKKVLWVLLLGGCLPLSLFAQSAEDVLRYSLEFPSYDAKSLVLPGISNASGFGSYQENPAVMGLFDESFGSFSLSYRNVEEETSFHGNSHEFSDSQTNMGDFGLVYKIPAFQGNMAVGGGYSQTSDFNRAMGLDLFNNRSTLTDSYNTTPDDSLFFAAFDVYAIDYATNDSTFDETASIFRIGYTPQEFPGVKQDMELTERGNMGEYSLFFSTEFQKNLFIGASVGLLAGSYEYERQFLESDPDNIYDGNLIDSNDDGTGDTDIQSVLSVDRINAEFTGFSARIGALYRITPHLHIGGSYEFPGTLSFSEHYNTRLESTFDNGPGFEERLPGSFTYKIKRPARVGVGFTLADLHGITISASAEQVDHADAELNLEGTDIAFQNTENDFIDLEFKEVVNLRFGLEVRIADEFIPRFGYAWYPSVRESFDATREFFNAGFTAKLSDYVWFDLGARYSFWDDQNRLYTYDTGTGPVDEVVSEQVTRLHVMGGLRFGF